MKAQDVVFAHLQSWRRQLISAREQDEKINMAIAKGFIDEMITILDEINAIPSADTDLKKELPR